MSVERLAAAFAAMTCSESHNTVENTSELRSRLAAMIRSEDPAIMPGVRMVQTIVDAYLEGNADVEAAARELIMLVALNCKDRLHGRNFTMHLTDPSSIAGEWSAMVAPVEVKHTPAIVMPSNEERKVFRLPTKPRLIK